jgi:hypothetical protein
MIKDEDFPRDFELPVVNSDLDSDNVDIED